MAGIHGGTQLIDIVREFYAVLLHHVAGTAHRGSPVVTVLYDIVTGTGHYETGTGTDVERVFSVASGTYDIDRFVFA